MALQLRLGIRSLIALLALEIFVSGCGNPSVPKLVQATGTVTHEGKGLTAGSIYFHPAAENSYKDDNPSSLLQTDGSFTMKTYPFGDGVAPGKYKVTLAPQLASRINKPEYGKVEMTPWEVEVPEGGVQGLMLEVK
jgi:hypothetical protein